MSRLGKSFKNRFLRRALAMVLAGTMVMTGMPVSFAAETLDAETTVETEVQGETEETSEKSSVEKSVEAAEDEELAQRESEETESEEVENGKSAEESETASKKASAAAESNTDDASATDTSTEVEETEVSETDTEEASETTGSKEEENEATSTSNTSTYASTEGDNKDLVKYNMEGFATSYNNTGVTGGGLLTPENSNYHKVTTEEEFLKAVLAARDAKNHAPVVIEITKDMNLGAIELGDAILTDNQYKRVIAKDGMTPLTHPTLMKTGVSLLTLQDTQNLTIFSKNGSSIKHCGILLKRAENIIIRNITFDELWEWDDLVYYEAKSKSDTSPKDENNLKLSEGAYDRNDWDYMCIDTESDGIWIDHCTFYKAYDGVIDIKNPKTGGEERVTISWCKFEDKSAPKTVNDKVTYPFYDAQIEWLKKNIDNTQYYRALMATKGTDVSVTATDDKIFTATRSATIKGMGFADAVDSKGNNIADALIEAYTRGQKKTHLFGQGDDATNAVGIRATLANNTYKNSMDRMPRLRFGKVHEYNCVLDSQELYDWKTSQSTYLGNKITSNGAISACDGEMLLENCYIKGIANPLNSGNGSSPTGAINAVKSLYYMGDDDKTSTELVPKKNTSHSSSLQTTDANEFRTALPYKDYITYNAATLNTDAADSIKSLAGAGKLTMSEAQWEKTSYGSRSTTTEPNEPESGEASESGKVPESGEVPPSTEPESSETPGSSSEGGETSDNFSLSADDFAIGIIASGTKKHEFTIITTDKVEVDDGGSKTINGIKFTNRIKLGGTGSATNRSIHFHAGKPGTLTVYATSGKASTETQNNDRQLGLYKYDGSNSAKITTEIASGSGVSVIKYDITAIGNYYIKSENSGINIYYLAFASKSEEGPGGSEPESSEAGSGESAPEGSEARPSESAPEGSEARPSESAPEGSEARPSESAPEGSEAGPGESAPESSEVGSGESAPEGSEAGPGESAPEGSEAGPGESAPEGSEAGPGESESSETGSSTAPGDGNYIKETLKFRADELATGTVGADGLAVGDYFTVTISSVINTGSKTIDGVSFTSNVKFGGKGSNTKNSIQIKSLGKGTLTVYAESGSASEERYVTLLDSTGKTITSTGVTTAASFTMEIPEKGIYYISSGGSSIFIYGIDFEVTYKEGETFEEEPEVQPTPIIPPDGDSVYDASEGNEQSKVVYNMEGYAAFANVTGGGLLKEDSANYHKVTNEKEFLEALSQIRTVRDKPNVIEITADLNLGDKELNEKYKDDNWNITSASGGTYSGIIRAYGTTPLMHPTLKKTGASYIKLHDFHNLTIYSKNGATIKHAGMILEGSSTNIVIRNLVFDELWEWDEGGTFGDKTYKPGDYDRNDWDYMTIEDNAEGIWVDHCTFYKAYDGIIDMKKGKNYQRVTISWCEFLPGSKGDTFFDEQMTWLENNMDSTTYYKDLRIKQGLTAKQVRAYAYGQKKTHLFGSDDSDVADKAINVTLANNYYKNSMDRMPRLRFGKAHEYNCILDAQDLYDIKNSGNSWLSGHVTSNGAISTCGGQLLLENCYIRGIENPLNSGNGSSPTGSINAVESLYYKNGQRETLEPKKNGSGSGDCLVTDAAKFKEALPYKDYITYDASKLYNIVMPYAGAGKLNMSTVQWEKTKYGSRTGSEGSSTTYPEDPVEPTITVVIAPVSDVASGEVAKGTKVTLTSATADAKIYYTKDGTDPTEKSTEYTAPIDLGNKEGKVVIKAIAVKDGNMSSVAAFEYTILAGAIIVDPDDPEEEKDIWITGLAVSYDYTGAKITPDIKVWDCDITGSNRLLVPGVDYTVAYKNNVKPETISKTKAEVIVTGKGNYAGKDVTGKFSIVEANDPNITPISVKGAKIELLKKDPEVYDGTPKYPGFKLVFSGKSPATYEYEYDSDAGRYTRKDGDMNINVAVSGNINKGSATILVTGAKEKDKTTSVKASFKITPVDLSKANVTVSPSAAYGVKGAVPESLTVTYNGMTLVNGKDYTVKYGNNKKAGAQGTVTVTGKGNYTKKANPATFKVDQLDMSELSVDAVTACDKLEAGKVKATVLDKYGNELKASQYTLKIYKEDKTTAYGAKDKLSAGTTIYVEATAKDTNLKKSTDKVPFTVGKDISKAKFELLGNAKKGIAYTGSEIELADSDLKVTLKDVTGPLKMGEDYEIVAYSNNINKGTATAVIKGIGDYSGTKTIKFKITQKPMKNGNK